MNDKEYAKQKKRIEKLTEKWHDPMGLSWFHIDTVWDRARDDDVPATAAKTSTSWQYRNATITWFLPACADNDDDFMENIVVHEFVHILVAPMVVVNKEEDLPIQHEYATECIARAIQWVREAGVKDAKV